MFQVKALQWVQKNINSFGGDPNRVTLVGQAGGACAAAAHTYSPMSQGEPLDSGTILAARIRFISAYLIVSTIFSTENIIKI